MTSNTVSWIFGKTFFVIGVLNAILLHLVPGIFCLLLSILYVPQTFVLTIPSDEIL